MCRLRAAVCGGVGVPTGHEIQPSLRPQREVHAVSDKHKPEGGNPGMELCCPRCVKKMTPTCVSLPIISNQLFCWIPSNVIPLQKPRGLKRELRHDLRQGEYYSTQLGRAPPEAERQREGNIIDSAKTDTDQNNRSHQDKQDLLVCVLFLSLIHI